MPDSASAPAPKIHDLLAEPGLAPVGSPQASAAMQATQQDARHLLALMVNGEIIAKAALWPETTHLLDGRKVGFIGGFQAKCAESGAAILAAACEKLREAGAELAVGPLDGSTWRAYRLATGSQGETPVPPFLLEPQNPDWYPTLWLNAGFSPLAEYYSSLVCELERADPKVGRARERLLTDGVTFHALDLDNWERELAEIHALSLIAFTPNFLYEPLPLEAFAAGYAKARALVDPQLVLLARRGGVLAGYCFCLPNPPMPGSVIVKTLAVLPGREFAGLGSVLLEETQGRAAELGYQCAIHALMHEGNRSRNLSSKYGEVFRTYALYAQPL